MSDAGTIFPPRDVWDIAAYDTDEIVDGYLSHCIEDVPPGDNRAPGYRWGWLNARKDATHVLDGFEGLRFAYIRMSRRPN